MNKSYRDANFTFEETRKQIYEVRDGTRIKLDYMSYWDYKRSPNVSTVKVHFTANTESFAVVADMLLVSTFELVDKEPLTFFEGFCQYRHGLLYSLDHINKLALSLYGEGVGVAIPSDVELLKSFETYRASLS
jgi:hypothetical protein